MKRSMLALLLSFSVCGSLYAGDAIVYKLTAHETLTLKKISSTRFEKITQNITGRETITLTSGQDSKELGAQDINTTDNTSHVAIEVTGKNIVKVEDQKEGINQEVQASINKSLFGKVQKIKIDSETMQVLYAKSMKKTGLDALKNLRILGVFGSVQSSIVSSDLNCDADGDLLVCEQDQTLLFAIGN